jgi:NAD-dependent DNA ligase
MFGSIVNNKGKTEKNKKVKSGKCIFPFTYKWKKHDKCYKTDKGSICATSISDKSNRRTLKTYGYCKTLKKIKTLKVKKIRGLKITIKKIDNPKKNSNKKKTIKRKMPRMKRLKMKTTKSLNKTFIGILEEFEELRNMQGNKRSAGSYHRAAESLMAFNKKITKLEDVKNIPNIGPKIIKIFKEHIETGMVKELENAKNDPIRLFPKIYGIGPKKAKKLIDSGITTIAELREKQKDVLNPTQIAGLKYYEDIIKRIPRAEINEFNDVLSSVFATLKDKDSQFKIVGSYRRGAANSGDIDIIITNSKNDNSIFRKFIDALAERDILIHFFTRGEIKSLTMGQLKGQTPRRLDFMYAPPGEYAFATLYFTGSKNFNVLMRQRALDMGYTMNEHGLYKMNGRKKGSKLDMAFHTEESIFEFLGLKYKTPVERVDGRAILVKSEGESKNKKISPRKQPKLKKMRSVFSPKKSLIELSKNGITSIQGFSEEKLSKMILFANDTYYNKKPVVSDNIYDILKEYIYRKYPKNETIKEVGAPIKKNKVALPYYMGSMEKIKPDTKALTNWKKKYKGSYVISAKLDGMSVMYSTESGEPKLYSRGGATIGLDLSHLIPYLKLPDIPNITIRGELIIPIALFNKKYKVKGYKSARNFVGGVMNSVGREVQKWKDLNMVAYEVIKPEMKPSDQMKWLKKNNVIVVKNTLVKEITNESLSEVLVDWRSSYKYEIDGIIVVNDKIYPREDKNPAHAFAFKMVLSDQIAEVKVLDIDYHISKYGYLKPVVQIEPVHLKGADIEFATAHNIKNVIDNKIGIGAIVQLIRSGDVIPKIEKVIVPAKEVKLPIVPWKWNETHVDAILKDVESNEVVRNKNVISFFKTLNIASFGPGNVTKVIEEGFDNIPKILSMNIDDFVEIPGFQKTNATKVYNSIKSKMADASLAKIMDATNIFGRGMSESRISAILKEYPTILTMKATSDEKAALIQNIPGFADKISQLFVKHIPAFIEFMKEINLEKKLTEVVKIDETNPLFDKKILMTGFRDKNLEIQIKKKGGKIATSVSKKLFVVIVPNMDIETSKIKDARKKKLRIITADAFIKKYL